LGPQRGYHEWAITSMPTSPAPMPSSSFDDYYAQCGVRTVATLGRTTDRDQYARFPSLDPPISRDRPPPPFLEGSCETQADPSLNRYGGLPARQLEGR